MEEYGLPKSRRKCRDLLCLVAFIAMWTALIAVGWVGWSNGNPERLLYGSDWEGKLCDGSAKGSGKWTTYPRTDRL